MSHRNHALPVVALAAAAVMSVALLGCSPSTNGGDGASGGVTTITFWNGFTGPDGQALKDRIAAFNKENDDVQVDMTIMPWDVLQQKLLPSLASGKGPDISVNGVEAIPTNAGIGAFGPVDEYYSRWDDKGKLFTALSDATMFDGTHYTVPMTYSPMLLYINKKLFADAGLDPESPPTTMEELHAAAVALTKDTDGDGASDQYGFVMPSHNGPQIWENLMWNNGGGTVSADGSAATIGEPESIEAVQEWIDLIKSPGISPGGLVGSDGDSLFQAGKGAMILEGPWMINGFLDAGIDFDVIPVPGGPGGQFTISNSSQFFMSKQALESEAKKAAAWRFFDFWNSKDNQTVWATTSGNPPTRSDITEADLADNSYVGLFNANRGENGRFFLANILPVNEVRGIYETAMEQATSGAGDTADLMRSAQEEISALLEQNR